MESRKFLPFLWLLVIVFAGPGWQGVQAQAVTDFAALNYSINANSSSREKMAAVTESLEKLMIGYNSKLRPDTFGPPTIIWINVLIVNIASVSEVNMEFQVDLYLRQSWRDDRLDFSALLPPELPVVHLSQEFLKDLWAPDTYFWNEKAAEKLEPVQLVRLYRNGTLQTSTRLTLTAACELNLGNFPMDNQVCGVDFGSFGYTTDQMDYNWEDGQTVQLELEYSTLPQFKIKAYRTVREVKRYVTGNFAKFSIKFLFLRLRTFYIFQVYVPSVLVVIVAYFALWMGRGNQDLLGARLGLCITSVLTMTTVYTTANSNSPPVSYVKGLDVYLAICFVVVFVTMLQSALVVYLRKKLSSLEEEEGRVFKYGHFLVSYRDDPQDKKGAGGGGVGGAERKKELKRQKKFLIFLISRMDVVCRTIFPLIFGAFNLAYWTYYLKQTQVDYEGWTLTP